MEYGVGRMDGILEGKNEIQQAECPRFRMHLNYIPRGSSCVSEDCGGGFTGELTRDDGTAGLCRCLCQARLKQRTNTPRKQKQLLNIFGMELGTPGWRETMKLAQSLIEFGDEISSTE